MEYWSIKVNQCLDDMKLKNIEADIFLRYATIKAHTRDICEYYTIHHNVAFYGCQMPIEEMFTRYALGGFGVDYCKIFSIEHL